MNRTKPWHYSTAPRPIKPRFAYGLIQRPQLQNRSNDVFHRTFMHMVRVWFNCIPTVRFGATQSSEIEPPTVRFGAVRTTPNSLGKPAPEIRLVDWLRRMPYGIVCILVVDASDKNKGQEVSVCARRNQVFQRIHILGTCGLCMMHARIWKFNKPYWHVNIPLAPCTDSHLLRHVYYVHAWQRNRISLVLRRFVEDVRRFQTRSRKV